MLVTFRTKAYADITMFGDVAVELLKLGGLTGNVPTALVPTDIPGFLDRLERGLKERRAAEEPPTAPAGENAAHDERGDEDAEPKVPISHRALPLIRLLRAAQAQGADVIASVSG